MCPGRDNAVWQVPVDEEAAAAAAEAAEAAEAAGVGGAVAVPEVAAEAVAAAEAAAAAVRESMARARMRSAAAFLLAGVRGLSVLIASTEGSCGMLDSAIDLLHEAAQELHLALSDAGWILALPLQGAAAGVLQGPIPTSIDAARRIVGRLCGTLPPDWYLQIYECSHHLSPIAAVYAKAYALLIECFEILDFTEESQPWRRWNGRMDDALDQPSLVQKSLLDAHNGAKIAHSDLLNLVELWNAGAVARMDLPGALSSAEVNLDAAAELMDQALTAMGRMSDALELQAYELMILARNPEDQA